MAFEVPGFKVGVFEAGADLSALQYTFVRMDNTGKIVGVTAATQAVFGVLQNKPTAGQAAEVMQCGVTKMKAGAAVAAGAEVMSDSTGRAITAVTTGNRVSGIACEASAAANVIIGVSISFPIGRIV